MSKGQVIAVDGKIIRRVKSPGKKSLIHMVSAWACENNLVLGQVKTDEKYNEICTNYDLDHGRIETRAYILIKDFQFIEQNNGWTNLKSIIKIESTGEFKNSKKATEKATRYYISSLQNDANKFQKKMRSHWAIENKLHWTLDVAFSEDASRKANAAQNYSILLKIALNLLKNVMQQSYARTMFRIN